MSLFKQIAEEVDIGWDDKYHWYVSKIGLEAFGHHILEEAIRVITDEDYHGAWLGARVREHFGVWEAND